MWISRLEKTFFVPYFIWIAWRAFVTPAEGPEHLRQLLVFGLFSLAAWALLCNREPDKGPQSTVEVVVPLVSTFFFLGFPFAHGATIYAAPEAALCLSLPGYALTIWALFYLGQSFSIVVAVRELIPDGPYRYVRHPMYIGYILQIAGIVLADVSLLGILYGAAYVSLLLWRATLEERAMFKGCKEYVLYMALVPAWWPRKWPRISRARGGAHAFFP